MSQRHYITHEGSCGQDEFGSALAANTATNAEPVLRGRVRINQILPVIGLSRTKVHDLVSRGEFPAPVRLSAKCSLYDAQAVNDWIADPIGWIERNKPAAQDKPAAYGRAKAADGWGQA